MNNYVSINLKKDQIVIKISEEAEQKQIISSLLKKLPDLKKLYKEYDNFCFNKINHATTPKNKLFTNIFIFF